MNIKRLRMICLYAVDIIIILSMTLSLSTAVQAAPVSPFIGRWYAVDADGSDIRLSIGSGIDGSFLITWTESYISACDGGPGIVRGVGWLNEENPNLLEADLHLQCFTIDFSLDFHQVWRFHPDTNKLSSIWDGFITIWHRPTRRPAPLPRFDLRVQYGDNWVESFYEAGHTVWVTVTESDGVTVKGMVEATTEPKEYWGWESGFQSMDEIWTDTAGNPLENPPDIKPYDWVFGWVDNGASAKVQIGDIVGVVDLASDSVAGTILATWFDSNVNVECFPWGSSDPETPMHFDSVYPDGADPYYCTWDGEWDILGNEPVGVGYFGADGHWVANVFRNPRFTVFPEYEFIEAWEWLDGVPVTATVAGKSECEAVGVPGYREDNPWSTFAGIALPEGCDVIAGDEVTLTNGIATVSHTVQEVAVTEVDKIADTVSGTAAIGTEVIAWVHGFDQTEMRFTITDGTWLADYAGSFDLVENMCGRAEIRDEMGNSTAVDWCIPNPRFSIFPEWNWFDAMDWPDGSAVEISVEGKPECIPQKSEMVDNFFNGGFPDDCDIVVGDTLTFTDGETTRTHTVRNLAITTEDKIENIVAGVAEEGALVHVWAHGLEGGFELPIGGEGTWLADFDDIGIDLVENMCGRAEIRDETGNSTAVDWCIPNPRFTIFPEWDWYDASDWPDGATVDITVEGKAECTTSSESWGSFFSGGFPEDCNIVIGDTLTFTDGITIRTHTVQNLGFTTVDKVENIVAGVADEGALVYVWAHGLEGVFELAVGMEGTWLADFDDIGIDLVEGMGGRAEIRDAYGNATALDWWIPNPRFIIFPEWNWYDGIEWPDGSAVNITVEGKPECIPVKSEITDNFFNGGFTEDCDIVIGDTLTFSDGETTRTHTVQNLAILTADVNSDLLSGTADPFAELTVFAYDIGEIQLHPAADGDGSWAADFSAEGIDLVGGMAGRAEIYDVFGNATSVEWVVPVTVFVTGTDDVLANDGVCTLREAVIAANTNTPSGDLAGECPAGIAYGIDIIVLAADQNYSLTIDSTYEDGSFDGDLDFWDNTGGLDLIITVDGGGATISQDAGVDDRVMDNLWADVRLENLTLNGGNVEGEGGGILNHGRLTLVNTIVDGNHAAWSGGGISNTDIAWMSAISSTISNNTAPWAGGIQVSGSKVTLDATTVSGNMADNDGGGIFIRDFDAGGTITPVPSDVTISNGSQINGNSAAWGGGISSWSSTLTIDASSVFGNTVTNSGGGILIHEGGFASIVNGSLIAENAANWGAGISNWDAELTIQDSILSANNAVEFGGGLENGGSLEAINTAFLNNNAGGEGDAVWSFTNVHRATSVTYSCITGNGSTAVSTVLPVYQEFPFNWWGDPSGPGGVGPGSGDTIGDLIEFYGWLAAPPLICAP